MTAIAQPNIVDELREPEEEMKPKKKTITIIMPDGKKVKKVKQDTSKGLAYEGTGRKGKYYVREDGKRVRRVKKGKDKKSKMEEENRDHLPPLPKGWTEHFHKRSGRWYYYNGDDEDTTWDRPTSPAEGSKRKANPVKEDDEDSEAESVSGDANSQESEEREYGIFRDASLRTLDSSLDASFVSGEGTAVTAAETISVDWDLQSSTSTLNTCKSEPEADFSRFLESLEEEEEEPAQKEEEEEEDNRKSYVKRASQKSIELLQQANRYRRLSEQYAKWGNLKAQAFRHVNRPLHPTQAPNKGPAYNRRSTL